MRASLFCMILDNIAWHGKGSGSQKECLWTMAGGGDFLWRNVFFKNWSLGLDMGLDLKKVSDHKCACAESEWQVN